MLERILATFDLEKLDAAMIPVGMVLFWAYYKIASGVLFKPLVKLCEEREKLTVGAQQGATDTIQEAARLEKVFEESINEARRDAVTARLERLSQATKEASKIVGEAESEAKNTTAQGRSELSQLEDRLRGELAGQVDQLAGELAQKILAGRQSSGASA